MAAALSEAVRVLESSRHLVLRRGVVDSLGSVAAGRFVVGLSAIIEAARHKLCAIGRKI